MGKKLSKIIKDIARLLGTYLHTPPTLEQSGMLMSLSLHFQILVRNSEHWESKKKVSKIIKNVACLLGTLENLLTHSPYTRAIRYADEFIITFSDLGEEFGAEPTDLEADEGFTTILPCGPPEGYPR